MGSGGSKTAEKTRAQSPKSIWSNGGGLSVKEKAFVSWKQNILMWNKSYNPWLADDESSMSQGEAEAWRL